MRDKQLRIEHAAVKVDARAWGDAAAGALLPVEGGKPQVEIVIEMSLEFAEEGLGYNNLTGSRPEHLRKTGPDKKDQG